MEIYLGKKMFMRKILILKFTLALALISNLAFSEVEKTIDVKNVQKALLDLCYDPGPIDGKWGKKTEKAVKSLFSFNGLKLGEHFDKKNEQALIKLQKKFSILGKCNQSSFNKNLKVWVVSCEEDDPNASKGIQRLTDNSFAFTVKQGEVGPCPSDKEPAPENSNLKWSERAELTSDNMRLQNGLYQWSATISVQNSCKQLAHRSEIFQVHDGGYIGAPPSNFGYNASGFFKTNPGGTLNVEMPHKSFSFLAHIEVKSKFVKVNYYVDGQLLAATEDEKENTGKTYVKFGVYRAGSHCAVTHKYENVKFVRVF